MLQFNGIIPLVKSEVVHATNLIVVVGVISLIVGSDALEAIW